MIESLEKDDECDKKIVSKGSAFFKTDSKKGLDADKMASLKDGGDLYECMKKLGFDDPDDFDDADAMAALETVGKAMKKTSHKKIKESFLVKFGKKGSSDKKRFCDHKTRAGGRPHLWDCG